MTSAASYILTVTAAAMLAAIVKNLAGKGTMGALVRLLAGIFMALVILSPVMELELPEMENWLKDFRMDGQNAAAEGQSMAGEASREIIKARTEAYILDKAAACGAVLEADVSLDDSGLPCKVVLRGSVAPAVKARLTRWIRTDLGIEEEVQHWGG